MWALKVSTLINTSQITANKASHHNQDSSLLTPTSNFQYMKFSLISASGFHPWSHVRRSWTHPASSFPWLTPETKRWNLGLNPCSPSLSKTSNKSGDFKEDFLFHPTTLYPATIKTLQKGKGLLPLTPLIFNSNCSIAELNSKYLKEK